MKIAVLLPFLLLSLLAGPGHSALLGEYFDNQNFTGTRVTRNDPAIDFNWGEGSPVTGIGIDSFSVRWTGEIVPQFSEGYTFTTTSDDGIRLWIDGRRVINNWTAHLLATDTVTLSLKANTRYPIQLEFFDQSVSAVVTLRWTSASQPSQIIPSTQLFLVGANTNHSPNRPFFFAPDIDGLTVDPTDFVMKTDGFSDPDAGDAIRATEWEIWSVNPSERVWALESSGTTNLYSVRLPLGQFENSFAGRSSLKVGQNYLLRIRHQDNSGAEETEWSRWSERTFTTTHEVSTFIPQGATWRFRDNNTDLGTVWRGTNFNDQNWSSGRAQFGFGDGDEVTMTCCSAGTRPITTYFRHSFVVTNAALVTGLIARLLRDDGAVVYFNGTEVQRSNLPQGNISALTLASASATDAEEFYRFQSVVISPSFLHAGTNVVAVEVHQSSATSSDLSFDFELLATVIRPPRLQIAWSAECLTLSWDESAVILEEAFDVDGPWSVVMGEPVSPYLLCGLSGAQYFRLRRLEIP